MLDIYNAVVTINIALFSQRNFCTCVHVVYILWLAYYSGNDVMSASQSKSSAQDHRLQSSLIQIPGNTKY